MSQLRNYLKKTPENQYSDAAIAYLAMLDRIESVSPLVASRIKQELIDQRSHLKLIASENYSSLACQLAMGNLLTDKYAEGHPFHRFYAGCENVDIIEQEAVDQLKKLYGAEFAYAQPHSGADANLVAFWAILATRIQTPETEKLGKKSIDELSAEEYEKIRQLLVNQKIMGLSLNSGGHLTHGYRHNVSSKMMKAIFYEVDPHTHLIDYHALAEQVKKERPTILLAGYSAHSRKLNFAKFREIADSVGAVLMVDMAHFAGLVAGKVFTGEYNPVPYAHLVTSTSHKTLRGPRGGFILSTNEFAEALNKGCPLVLGGPLPHVLAAKAVAFKEANSDAFITYAHKIVENSQTLADQFVKKGHHVVTGGTDNHLMVLDLTAFGLTGRHAESALREANLTVNRNAIPYDQNGPWYTSGIRLGTAALTTLGMGKEEMRQIADYIIEILSATKPATVAKTGAPSRANAITETEVNKRVKSGVHELLKRFPLYPEINLDN